MALYSRLTRGGAWRNPIGLSLIIEALLIAGLFVPQIMSLFWNLNRVDSRIAAWADVALIGLVSPVMAWRCLVFLRMGPLPERDHRGTAAIPPPQDEEAPDGAA